MEAPDAEIEEVDEDHPPYPVSMRRLGAVDGGVWIGNSDGTRIIMRLVGVAQLQNVDPEEIPEVCPYVAVLRRGERPHVFAIHGFQVGRKGSLGMSLAAMGRDASPESIHVEATVDGDTIRFTWTLGDEDGVFPSGVALQRESGSVGEDEARLRRGLEKIARGQ